MPLWEAVIGHWPRQQMAPCQINFKQLFYSNESADDCQRFDELHTSDRLSAQSMATLVQPVHITGSYVMRRVSHSYESVEKFIRYYT